MTKTKGHVSLFIWDDEKPDFGSILGSYDADSAVESESPQSLSLALKYDCPASESFHGPALIALRSLRNRLSDDGNCDGVLALYDTSLDQLPGFIAEKFAFLGSFPYDPDARRIGERLTESEGRIAVWVWLQKEGLLWLDCLVGWFDEDSVENSTYEKPLPIDQFLFQDGWGFSEHKHEVLAAARRLGLDQALGVCCLGNSVYDAEPGPMKYGPKLIFLGNFG
jgi:hypothetical protein